jgi:uncharacterized membrane protein
MSTQKDKNWLYWLLVIIAFATAVSGLVQMLLPSMILGIIQGEQSAANLHSFAIVGMFMLLFGLMLLHALLSQIHHPLPVFWSALQKFGAFAAVALGIIHGLFAPLAWAVSLFDLASGLLLIMYWRSIK